MLLAITHSLPHYPLIFLLLGLLILLLGRQLFWLFVGAAGFVAGCALAPILFPHQGEPFILVIGLVLGVVGILLAIFLQKIAVAVAGFAVGAFLAVELCAPLLGGAGLHGGGLRIPGEWLCLLIGGILGAIAMLAFFNWALIILSSLDGAHLIIQGLPAIRGIPPLGHYYFILFVILAIIGVAVQASTYRHRPASSS
jgi:ACR3 family arsenite efflux pump ArsB